MSSTAEAPTVSRAPAARLLEWLWRRDALARVPPAPSAGVRAQLDRARALADAAARAEATAGLGAPSAALPALVLYREAARRALCALSGGDEPARDLHEAFARVPAAQLARLAGDEAALSAARAALLERDPDALAPDALAADVRTARAFVARMLDELTAGEAREVALVRERVLRTGGALAALALLAFAVLVLPGALRPDLAAAATWRTSSTTSEFADHGRGGHAPGPSETATLFHTAQEPSPWIEFDLGQVRTVRRVRLVNRADCCWERAAPLVVETSTDARAWSEAARRPDLFYDWRARFAPRPARYVRIRSLQPTMLHLNAVEIR